MSNRIAEYVVLEALVGLTQPGVSLEARKRMLLDIRDTVDSDLEVVEIMMEWSKRI